LPLHHPNRSTSAPPSEGRDFDPQMTSEKSEVIERNRRFMPGGTSSSARYLDPQIVFAKADAAALWDMDGKKYIDLNCAFGAILLGHNNPAQIESITSLTKGIDLVGLGTTELEGQLAERLCTNIPCAEMVAFCCSGTEATFHAVRLARAVTGRKFVVKFHGAYHGWHDYVSNNNLSVGRDMGPHVFESSGALPAALESTLVLPLNDLALLAETLHARKNDIAAVLLEPMMHNVGCIEIQAEFLTALRSLTEELGIVLVFDEVITGFRHAPGGFQEICEITPDLGTFGKALGNGYPISLLAGRRNLMMHMQPRALGGDVLFGGTYNAHPISIAAALAVIDAMQEPGAYDHLFALGAELRQGLENAARQTDMPLTVSGFGSVTGFHFGCGPAQSYTDLTRIDEGLDLKFRRGLIDRGFACSTTPLRRIHLTLAHTLNDVHQFIASATSVLQSLRDQQPET